METGPTKNGGDARSAAEAFAARLHDPVSGVHHFPIRHHSPACAVHLAAALDELHPGVIVIEMPGDFEPLVPMLADPALRTPVAIVTVHTPPSADDDPVPTGYWPVSATAPEWAALRKAATTGIPVVLCDLPAALRRRQVPSEDEDETDDAGTMPLLDETPIAWSDYAQDLVLRTGSRDFDEVWDRLFESRIAEGDWRRFFGDVGVHCLHCRETTPRAAMAADGTLAREGWMRARIAEAVATADGRPVAVVTGGFHTPALLDLSQDSPPAPLKRRDVSCHLVRYDQGSLDRTNGYAAGMRSPFYYERWMDAVLGGVERPALEVAVSVFQNLRMRLASERPGLQPSFPALVEAARHCEGLAALRGLAGPGRSEIADSARSCFVKDEDPRFGSPLMETLSRELAGDGFGTVPASAGAPPLLGAVLARARALGFVVDDGIERTRDLDVQRKPKHRAASRFLHAMRILDSGFARKTGGSDWTASSRKAVLFETWSCAWSPTVEGGIVALSGDGSTIEEACTNRLRRRVRRLEREGHGNDSEAAVHIVLVAVQAGIRAFGGEFEASLSVAIAEDPDLARVGRCLAVLAGLRRGRRVLGLDATPALDPLLASCYRRAVDLVPTVAAMREAKAVEAGKTLADIGLMLEAEAAAADGFPFDREVFDDAIDLLMRSDPDPFVLGAVSALAYLSGSLDAASLVGIACGHLSGASVDAAERVAPLAGLITVRPALLRRVEALADGLDAAMDAMEEADFVAVLPHLRMCFASLDPAETEAFAGIVADMHGLAVLPSEVRSVVSAADAMANAALSVEFEALAASDGLSGWISGREGVP